MADADRTQNGQPLEDGDEYEDDEIVTVEIVEDAGLQHEEAAVDPALAHLRLLAEPRHAMSIELEGAESRRRPDRSDRGDPAALARGERRHPDADDQPGRARAAGTADRAAELTGMHPAVYT